jgi:integrase
MASLGRKNGVFLARFRYAGKEFKKSLKTSDPKDAEAALLEIRRTIHRLTIGILQLPAGVDAGEFIVSGGTRASIAVVSATPPLSFAAAVAEYLGNLAQVAPSHRYTIGVHLRNLQKGLGPVGNGPVDRVGRVDLERHLQTRLRDRARVTVAKERESIKAFFGWLVGQDLLKESPAIDLTAIKAGGGAPIFRTVAEIEAILARGGLAVQYQWEQWDRLYLAPAEIAELLSLVRQRAKQEVSFLLHAIPAYTGMRRGEVLRLRWDDVDFDHDGLIARSHKQSRQEVETTRQIDLHAELKQILLGWRRRRPRGQFVVGDETSLAPLTPQEASRKFWQPLRGTCWCLASRRNRFKIGFHTYRHSFASNLAAAGVDQRLIDEFMGHQTEAMRKRYRHLFPAKRRAAIESFSLA